jgi:hypothetical protein
LKCSANDASLDAHRGGNLESIQIPFWFTKLISIPTLPIWWGFGIFDRNRTVESHSRSWGVCHSLAETCGFLIKNPLAGHVRIDWFSWLPVI